MLTRGLRTLITSSVICIKTRLLLVVTCPYTTFCQCRSASFARRHCFDVLKNSPKGIAVRTRVDKHVRSIRNRSSSRVLRPFRKYQNHDRESQPSSSSQSIDVSGCLSLRSTIRHLRDQSHQSYSLEANSTVVKKCLVTTSLHLFARSCRFH